MAFTQLLTTAQEHAVGRYSADLLLEDVDGRKVVVENQFGTTDHDHLGKLLTYCAGTEARVVIWIAETLNDEHAAALEWLNQNTGEDVGFFGVELELLQIGDSPYAPNFRVLVKPNQWVKAERSATAERRDWSWDTYRTVLGIRPERIEVARELVQQHEVEISSAAAALDGAVAPGLRIDPKARSLQRHPSGSLGDPSPAPLG